MNTTVLMTASALTLGLLGLAGSFLPHELLHLAGLPVTHGLAVAVQLVAAVVMGFAALNWMAKDSMIGGIYQRPIVVGNTLHYVVGALTLVKAVLSTPSVPVVLLTVVYAVFALGFGFVMFGAPRTPHAPEQR